MLAVIRLRVDLLDPELLTVDDGHDIAVDVGRNADDGDVDVFKSDRLERVQVRNIGLNRIGHLICDILDFLFAFVDDDNFRAELAERDSQRFSETSES